MDTYIYVVYINNHQSLIFWKHTHSGDVSVREFTKYHVEVGLRFPSTTYYVPSCGCASDAMFSAPFVLLSLRCVPPAVVLLGSSVTYVTAWTALRCASLVLSARAASRLEVRLYSWYQAMVGFWFETWSGVEVGA